VILASLLYAVFSFALIGHNEVFPVWAKASPHLGGLGFSLQEIGLALTIAGVLFLPFSIFLYPLVSLTLLVDFIFSIILIYSQKNVLSHRFTLSIYLS